MADEDNDWRRRFTAQDIDEEEEDYRSRRTTPADRGLPQESVVDPAAVTVLVDERGVVSDVVISAQWRDVVAPRDLGRVLLEAVRKAIANRVTSQVEQLVIRSRRDPAASLNRPFAGTGQRSRGTEQAARVVALTTSARAQESKGTSEWRFPRRT